jgi:hypothetical protein
VALAARAAGALRPLTSALFQFGTPTAAVLYQFREVCIKGLATRVAHFDQPAFAWR